MTSVSKLPKPEEGVRTGRRPNPAINGPRDKTICFMLSEAERVDLDRLAFCLNLTRSAVLANTVVTFLTSVLGDGDSAASAEKELSSRIRECRKAVELRGQMAREFVKKTNE